MRELLLHLVKDKIIDQECQQFMRQGGQEAMRQEIDSAAISFRTPT